MASLRNINWRDVQTKNVANNVDMSCLSLVGIVERWTLSSLLPVWQ